jgi:hypothetical protein
VLAPISNPDGNGNYLVDWSDVTGATSYQLEEAEDLEFTSSTAIYEGADSEYRVTGQGDGIWYYRVRASSLAGDGPWSNTEWVDLLASVATPLRVSLQLGLSSWTGVYS